MDGNELYKAIIAMEDELSRHFPDMVITEIAPAKLETVNQEHLFLATGYRIENGLWVDYPERNDKYEKTLIEHFVSGYAKSAKATGYMTKNRGHKPEVVKKLKIGYLGCENKISNIKLPIEYLASVGLYTKDDEKKMCRPLHGGGDHIVFPSFTKDGYLNQFSFKPIDKAQRPFMTPKKCWREKICFYPKVPTEKGGDLVICEGQNDMLSVYEHTGMNAIATLGNLSEDQANAVAKMTKDFNLYLAFDNDDAGRKYTRKVFSCL